MDGDTVVTRAQSTMNDTLTLTDAGLYCAAGDFYIDPWLPVTRALITHAHGDHAHADNLTYLAAADSLRVPLTPEAECCPASLPRAAIA